jgi:RND family efflux transporter MFP subunit
LAFEVPGRLAQMSLSVGQPVSEGDILARLDQASFQTQLDNAQAAAAQTQASLTRAQDTLARQTQLLATGAVTRVSVDAARTEVVSLQAQLAQTQAGIDAARQDLARTDLRAPFDGVVSSVEVAEFATVGAGLPVTSLYATDTMEASFTVSFDLSNQLVVGTPVIVTLADMPAVSLDGVVTELGSRAATVSSFPVVVQLLETNPMLKAGMAVEVAITLPLGQTEGYELPLTAAILDGAGETTTVEGQTVFSVFVYDADSSSVVRREVVSGGVRGNNLIIVDGLSAGELVASAGVSFLRDGQQVSLLDPER